MWCILVLMDAWIKIGRKSQPGQPFPALLIHERSFGLEGGSYFGSV